LLAREAEECGACRGRQGGDHGIALKRGVLKRRNKNGVVSRRFSVRCRSDAHGPGCRCYACSFFMHLTQTLARLPDGRRAHWRLGYLRIVLVGL
jgi:hypothetical protein